MKTLKSGDRKLTPAEIAGLTKVPLAELGVALAHLVQREFIIKSSDGFAAYYEITSRGRRMVSELLFGSKFKASFGKGKSRLTDINNKSKPDGANVSLYSWRNGGLV